MSQCFHGGTPEVTVLMSCYNASRWLHEAIDSVLAQTFENFEFILLDDGSIDETWRIIQNYRDQDDRIIAISKKNTGLADSLNLGIAQAKGSWIARLDADDLCEPTRIEDQISFVRNHPEVVLLGTGCIEIDEYGTVIRKHLYPSGHRKLVQHLETLRRFFPHSSAFYHTDEVRRLKGYNLRILRAEDLRLWMELALRGKIACLSKPLVQIRRHSSQVSLDNNGRRQLHDATAAIVCYLLRKAGYNDPSTEACAEEWIKFLNWVENRIEKLGTFEMYNAWADARAKFFTTNNRLTGAYRFGARLLRTGHTSAMMREKFFGSSLPQRLAREWMKQSCLTF